ncbi:hypothetical protein [Methanococcoides sp. AM1]|uniref:hypothetical protein n=1 Tax=Methanococcoides sp. AM1 TaxID=1201011 RepID=UPI00108305B5|nr:hypothetical protein [Methanococcoides sp. AM1]
MNQENEIKATIVSLIAISLFIVSASIYLLGTDVDLQRTILISLSILAFGIIGILGLLKISKIKREKADRERKLPNLNT